METLPFYSNVNGNEYQKVSNSNEPVNRCMNEYFKAPKTYMALNKDNTHWVTVVMHKEKEEFQVLDSLMGKELDSTTRKLVEDLRREIGADIAEANATGSVQYPDVSTWPIKTYDMPQQEDGNSCGLFVLHCFKNWNGDTWDRSFSQRSIDGSRELMIGQLIFSMKNTLGEIKDKVIRIARRKK
ncbi:Sentrin-specific protease 2 [Hordeum vulgare]|nr:Sentrin-specific protease 2 [Hordeum vulgare]